MFKMNWFDMINFSGFPDRKRFDIIFNESATHELKQILKTNYDQNMQDLFCYWLWENPVTMITTEDLYNSFLNKLK